VDGKKAKKKRPWKPNVKQERFVDFYILLNGNGVKAVESAGYEGDNATLRATASRLLTNNNILALIEKRREEAKSARIGDIVERQEILTEIYRNKKAVEVPIDTIGAETGETEEGKFLSVKVAVLDKTKIKAIDTQNKMEGLYVQKHQVTDGDGKPLNLSLTVTFIEPKSGANKN
jgi:phage terminase small subunit